MRLRLLAILLVPAVTMMGLGWMVVGRANSSLNEAEAGLRVADLVESAADLDRALAAEALIMTKVYTDARIQSQASRREFVITDDGLDELRQLADDMTLPPVRRALVEAGAVQAARYDAGLGYVTPLQVVDLYRQTRRSVLDSVARVVSERSTNESELMAVVALAEARTAHLDERIAIELALSYGQWAPGQHAVAIEAIAAQKTSLRFAESIQTQGSRLRSSGALFRTREEVELTLDVPTISLEEWVDESDRWLEQLDDRINASLAHEQAQQRSIVADADRRRALTLLAVVLAVTIGSFLLVSSSVRLASRVGLISRRASALANGDYGSDVAKDVGGRDEIARLAASFDHMANQVRRREREQELHMVGMESIAAGSEIDATLAQISLLLGEDDFGRPDHLIVIENRGEVERSLAQPSMVVEPCGIDGLGSVPWNEQTRGALALAAMAVRRWQDSTQLEAQATFDPLTGIFNRRKTIEMLEQTLNPPDDDEGRNPVDVGGSDSQPTVIFVDVADFRSLNEAVGQEAGDRVLQQVATGLAAYADSLGGFAGRMDGDQFVVMLSSAERGFDVEDLSVHLTNLQAVVSEVVSGPGQGIDGGGVVAANCGAVISKLGTPVEQVLFEADVALGEAKTSGAPVISDEDLRQVARERLALRTEVVAALENGEFVAWYQPIWDRHGHRVVALEALVRWQRPDGRVESPFRFLPALEQQGLLAELDALVLSSVCHQIVAWRDSGLPVVPVHVNVSSHRLEEPTFVSETLAILAECQLDSDSLIIEITESGKISDVEAGGRRLQALRDEGLLVATDDFGQGYASLAYLQKLPVDILKVDREFVADIDESTTNQSIVSAVLQLAESLDLEVVAEGVERPEEADWLSRHDCQLQGFLFGRPAPVKETAALLARMRRPSSEASEWLSSGISDEVREAMDAQALAAKTSSGGV